MPIYVVVYDIPANNPEARDTIRSELETAAWAQVSESCYVVQRQLSAENLYKALFSKVKQPINNLYVFETTDNLFGFGAGTKADRWLDNVKKHIPAYYDPRLPIITTSAPQRPSPEASEGLFRHPQKISGCPGASIAA